MAANKRKILEAARKFAQKGASEKALKEYHKLLKLDPRDAKLRLEIGDAYRRWGQVDEAVDTYLKVAEQYMAEGFDARAVAVFKQILNLDPDRHGAHEPLADLYQRMGLTSEAIGALQIAADGYHRAGKKAEALGLLRKMATLDPTNTASRIKVADLLRQEGLDGEALAEYDEVVGELERQGDHEALESVCERILDIDAERIATLRLYAQSLMRRGVADQAEPFAKRAREGEPGEPQHYELLAEVYQALHREDALADTYRGLANLHRQRGDEDRAREILQRFVPPDEFDAPASDFGSDDFDNDMFGDAGELTGGDDAVLDEDEIGIGDFSGAVDSTLLTEDSILAVPSRGDAPDLFAGEATFDAEFGDVDGREEPVTRADGYLPDDTFEDDDSQGDTLHAPRASIDEIPLEIPAPEVRQPAAQPRRSAEEIEQVVAEASVYLRYGKRAQAVESLELVVAQQPNHRGALEKLGEAYAESGDAIRAVSSWLTAAELARDSGEIGVLSVLRDRIAALDADAAASLDDGAIGSDGFDDDPDDYLEIPDEVTERSIDAAVEAASNLPAAGSLLAASDASIDEASGADFELGDELMDEVELDTEDIENDLGEPFESSVVVSAGDAAAACADEVDAGLGEVLEPDAALGQVMSSDADGFGLDLDDIEIEPEDVHLGDSVDSGIADAEGSVSNGSPLAAAPPADPEASFASSQQILEDLEEADFYMEQGLSDEAEAIYTRLLSVAPNHPRVLVRLGEIAAARGDDPGSTGTQGIETAEVRETPVDNEFQLPDDSLAGLVPGAAPAGEAHATLDAQDSSDIGGELPEPIAALEPPAEVRSWHDDVETGEYEIEISDEEDLAPPAAVSDDTPDSQDPEFEDSATEGVEVFFDEPDELVGDPNEDSIATIDDDALQAPPPALKRAEPPDLIGDIPLAAPTLDLASTQGFDSTEEGFDLAAELSEAIEEGSSGASVSGYGNRAADDGFSEVFREFKKGVSESLKEGDHEAHYDLGIAYREMGLFEDAIGEFRASSLSQDRRIDSLHMMGVCALDLDRAPEAVDYFGSALSGGAVTRDQELALQFEMGRAYRMAGDVSRARDAFEAVAAIDPLFCDVENVLGALDEEQKPPAELVDADPDYESFDDFLAEMSDDETGDSVEAAQEAVSEMESFDDIVAEAENEAAPDHEPKRRKKISFL